MPFRKVQLPQKTREIASHRSSHSPSRQSAMGNRQLAPSAPPGRIRNREVKKSGLASNSNKPVTVDIGLQNKLSSGPVTKVGSMIPFQRASRRERYISPQAKSEGERNTLNKKNMPKKKPSDNTTISNPSSSQNNETSTTSDTKTANVTNQKQRTVDLQGGKSQSRSVRPKQKCSTMLKGQVNIASSTRTSNSSDSTNAALGADIRTEPEVVSVTTTSPRRRIVKRKSQNHAAESRSENESLFSQVHENDRGPQESDNVHLNSSDIIQSGVNSPDNGRTVSTFSSRTLNQSIPENRLGEESTVENNAARNNSVDESDETMRFDGNRPQSSSRMQPLDQRISGTVVRTESSNRNDASRLNTNEEPEYDSRSNNQTLAAFQPRPPPSPRVLLETSSSRHRDNQRRFNTGRPTLQLARALATDLDESSNAVATEGHERFPNSVRRSLDRSGSDWNDIVERPRLSRQSTSGIMSRARQRELIDVNSAVSDLTTGVPFSPRTVQYGPAVATSASDAASPRVGIDTPSVDEDIWVPRIRPNSRTVSPSRYEQTQRSPELSASMHSRQSDSPDVVFRNSPVTGVLPRRHSRLSASSDTDTYPAVSNTSRNVPTIPSRRGLYRALSVNDETNNNDINRSSPATPHNMTYNGIGNLDNDEVVSWRQIEMEHSYPSREPRQRLIYEDRRRVRETIVNSNTSGSRVNPSSIDSVPNIGDHQEFPPLVSSSSVSRDQTNGQASLNTGQDYGFTAGNRRSETPPPTPTPGRNPPGDRLSRSNDPLVDHLVLLASPIFGPLMLQASPAVLFNMLSRARRDFGGEFVELLIENVVLSLLAQHTFDATNQAQNNNGAPPPATQETIESLEKIKVTKQMVSDDAFCSICHCEYMMDEILDQLPCKHNFHNQCITVWLKKSGTCPVCRHKLYTESVE